MDCGLTGEGRVEHLANENGDGKSMIQSGLEVDIFFHEEFSCKRMDRNLSCVGNGIL